MGVVWERGKATVQDVRDALSGEDTPAYTTIMTVMSRLAEKGLLVRRKVGRAYVYVPATEKRELASSMLRALIRRLYDGSSSHAIAHLLETETHVDDVELQRLERLIQTKRREQAK